MSFCICVRVPVPSIAECGIAASKGRVPVFLSPSAHGTLPRMIGSCSNLMPLSFPRGCCSPYPEIYSPGFSIATASPGGPPPVATWDWALPGAGANRGREEAAGQRRHHLAHSAAPHQGELVGPSLVQGLTSPYQLARGQVLFPEMARRWRDRTSSQLLTAFEPWEGHQDARPF